MMIACSLPLLAQASITPTVINSRHLVCDDGPSAHKSFIQYIGTDHKRTYFDAFYGEIDREWVFGNSSTVQVYNPF